MKKYELIPVHDQNLWNNWKNTYISYTNSRIESLKQYKKFYSRDYLVYDKFAFKKDNNTYQQIVNYQDIIDHSTDISYIMISTQGGNGDYIKKNAKYMKDTAGNYKAYFFNYMIQTTETNNATHVLTMTENGLRYVEKEKVSGELGSTNLYMLESRQIGAVLKAKDENGNETKYFNSSLPLYCKEVSKDGDVVTYIPEPEEVINSSKTTNLTDSENSSLERYHLLFRNWFTIDRSAQKVYFNNSELGYRECFTNSFAVDFPLILGGTLPVLFTIVNNTMVGYKQKLKSSDFTLRVQNPLSGYRVVSTNNGKITYAFYKDLSSNTKVSFDLVVGSARLVKASAEGLNDSPTEGPRDIYLKFKKPGIILGLDNSESYSVEGLNPLDGFIPIIQRETENNAKIKVEPVYEADFTWEYVSDQKVKVNYSTHMGSDLNIEYNGF